MTPRDARLHVLVYGEIDSGVTDSLRLGVYVEPLAKLGVEVRRWLSFADDVLGGGVAGASIAGGDDLKDAGLTALAWADVVLFRRWRPTHIVCTECETSFGTIADLEAHTRVASHRTMVPDLVLRPLVDLLSGHPELTRSRAIVYDTDDDVLNYPAWTGFSAAAARERDLVLRMLALADLVTVSTPVLAERLAPHTRGSVSVVRIAIDPAWYVATTADPDGVTGDPRVVYHGVPVRLRDYEIARPAVDALAERIPTLRRVWLGAADEPRVRAAVDEALPWVEGLPAFASAITAARPDIGLAPLRDEPFNLAKSELHWIEYAMAGAPTVVSGFSGAGPFDVVRDGVDGLVARSPQDWDRHLSALATSPGLREELCGRARQRVLDEYKIGDRAPELADAFHWAAEHAGIGRKPAALVVPGHGSDASAPALRGPRVLVVGPGSASASDALRFDAVASALTGHDIELVNWTPEWPSGRGDPFDELECALGWSDVVVLRRHYRTWHACLICGLRTLDLALARDHGIETGHEVVLAPFTAVRPLVQLLEAEPGVLGERALVYDTDDDLFAADFPADAEDILERDLVARILKLSDLVTVTTPVLAQRLRSRTSGEVRVIRNAVDPAWYATSAPAADLPGDPRVVYHGVTARLRDYAVARPALDALAREMPLLRRVWLGSVAREVADAVDIALPWVTGLESFAAALVALRPDIGIAPIEDTPYNRARSELHWLEYAMAGAPTVVTGFGEAGPYDTVRDGVDGLVARTPADWDRHLRALATSRDLRVEIAGRARERVVDDYTVGARASEWADAYRWAAGHAGIGRGGRAAG